MKDIKEQLNDDIEYLKFKSFQYKDVFKKMTKEDLPPCFVPAINPTDLKIIFQSIDILIETLDYVLNENT